MTGKKANYCKKKYSERCRDLSAEKKANNHSRGTKSFQKYLKNDINLKNIAWKTKSKINCKKTKKLRKQFEK